MFKSSRGGPSEEKAGRRMPIRLGTALIAAVGLLLGPLAIAASAAVTPHATTPVMGTYVPVTPFRITDTRPNSGQPNAGKALAAAATLNVQVTGLGTVPAGASAAVLNVTAVNPTASGFLTVFPEGTTMPTVSSLNFVADETVANLVTVPLSSTGMVSIFNHVGSTNVVIDVDGYYTSTPSTNGSGLYNSMSPVRALGNLQFGAPVTANTSVPVQVTGTLTGVPATATAVVVNVTAAHGTASSYLTAYPAGVTTVPTASNVNFVAGHAVANRVTVGVGTGGKIEVYNHTGTVDVDVDVDGYYTGDGGTGSYFVPITPVRITDTRVPTNGTPIVANTSESFNLATTASGIPANAAAVATNFTVVAGDAPGYLTVYPTSATANPVASDVNWVANEIIPNFTIADANGTGKVAVYNSHGTTINVVIDAFGYFIAPTVPTAGLSLIVPSTTLAVGASLVANHTSSDTVTATVTDGAGGAAVVGDTVLFTATPSVSGDTCGTFSAATAVTIAGGVATVTYLSPLWSSTLTPPYCTITAEDATYGQTGSGTIANTEPGNTVAVVAASPTVPAVATSTDVVTATVTAATAGSAANDTVSFAVSGTGCGTVSPISGNTGPGDAAVSATYTAGTTVGFCTVTATESINGASGTVTITQSTPVAIFPPTVSFSPALASVAVSTTNTNLFTVTVANPGAVVSDPLSIAVTPAACSDATAVLTSPATNASGQDTVTYKAGAGLVACTVTVKEADAGVSGTAVVTQTTPATSVAVSASPVVVAHTTGTANITVTVTNPAAGDIGVPMVYSVAPVTVGFVCGTVASVTPLSSGGIAYATYTAGAGVGGFCTITAKTAVSLVSGTVNIDQV